MSVPSARRRGLRRVQALATGIAALLAVGMAVGVLRVFTAGASPLPAAASLYGATVAYGLREMAKLRERRLFRPGRPAEPHSAVVWWLLRLVLIAVVSTLPAVMLLGGLTNR
jgi:hypothetical protein